MHAAIEIEEASIFGTDGKPALSSDGDARTVVDYDARGNIVDQAYFGLDGKPAVQKDGYARRKWKFDARGNPIEETYFDVNGEPTLSEIGSAKVTQVYDSSGNLVEERPFGIDGLPALVKDGYATQPALRRPRQPGRAKLFRPRRQADPDEERLRAVKRQYDSFGNQTEIAFFDAGGAPTVSNEGIARIARR